MPKRQLILGSSSKPRQMLLKRLQIPFSIAEPNIDETQLVDETPTQLVLRLAQMKAQKIAEKCPEAVIIGADQVGVLQDSVLGKPLAHANAVKQLQSMSGNNVEFFIGLCLLDAKNQTQQLALEKFSVTFRKLTPQMIENYLQKEDALQCAGSFKAEGLGIALVEEFHDTDFSALIGLPLIRLTNMLENMGMGPL
ncbi:MAG: Maf family protein [Gammaproteobacteria bacterium]